jgi:hypothetical protein
MQFAGTRVVPRAAAAVAFTFGLLALQQGPASALPFHEMGAYASLDACNSARADLMDSGTVQPCYTRDGFWYFKFAQNF